MESSSMNLKVTPRSLSGAVQALDLEGEVDVYTAPVLRQAIVDQVEAGVAVRMAVLWRLAAEAMEPLPA